MNVKVGFRYAAGESYVDESESAIIAISHFEIDGHWVECEHATLHNEGPFLQIHLSEVDELYPYYEKGNETVREIRAGLTPAEWLEETTDEVLVLPVSTIEWVNMEMLVA